MQIEPEVFEFEGYESEQGSRPKASTQKRLARRPLRFPDDAGPRRTTNSEFNFEAEAFSFDSESETEQLEGYEGGAALEFEKSANTAPPIVKPARVSCASLDRKLPLFKAIGTNDPVGVLDAVCRRAVQMLDGTIGELRRIRGRVQAGEPPAFPLISDHLAWSLRTRMLMRVTEAGAWTARGPRTAEQIIRWLNNIRRTIAGGFLRYTCLDNQAFCGLTGTDVCCGPGTWAWVFPGRLRIHLCRAFWRPKSGVDAARHFEFQAQTIIHEVSHIYYSTEDSGRGPGHAECISQFVADANGSPIDPDFARFCGGLGPTR